MMYISQPFKKSTDTLARGPALARNALAFERTCKGYVESAIV